MRSHLPAIPSHSLNSTCADYAFTYTFTCYRNEKVVRPEWIVDSIKAGKLLPVREYMLYQGHQAAQSLLSSKTDTDAVTSDVGQPAKSTNDSDISSLTSGVTTLKEQRTNLPPEKSLEVPSKGADTAQAIPKAGDPNFVSDFYKNSRLHYLSTWGAELKEFTSKLIKARLAQGAVRPKQTPVPRLHGRVIMHIDMDSFFVSVTLRDKPHLRGKPIAVCHAGKGNSVDMEGGLY